jgi:hypothetical protein
MLLNKDHAFIQFVQALNVKTSLDLINEMGDIQAHLYNILVI